MNRALIPACVALAATVLLAGCNTASQSMIINDLKSCDRDYSVAIGGGGAGLSGPSFTATGHIVCKAQPPPLPTIDSLLATPPAAAPPA